MLMNKPASEKELSNKFEHTEFLANSKQYAYPTAKPIARVTKFVTR